MERDEMSDGRGEREARVRLNNIYANPNANVDCARYYGANLCCCVDSLQTNARSFGSICVRQQFD